MVARQSSEGEIRVIADMRITHLWDINRGYSHAGLKNIILDNDTLVAYAGNAELAAHTIQESRHLRGSQLVTALCESSRVAGTGEQGVEYLLAEVALGIRRIRPDGAEAPTRASWIGNRDVFECYQQHYHSVERPFLLRAAEQDERLAELFPDTPDTEAFLKMDEAIGALDSARMIPAELMSVDSLPELETVGEAFVTAFSKDGFQYLQQVVAVTGRDTVISGTEPQPILMGDVGDGAFSLALLTPVASGAGLVGLYFAFGRCGILYHPLFRLAPVIYVDTSQDEFIAAVAEDHGVVLDGPKLG